MDHERITELLSRYFDRAITDNDRIELEQLLAEHAEARELFWQEAKIHVHLGMRAVVRKQSDGADPALTLEKLPPITTESRTAPRPKSTLQWASRNPRVPAIAIAVAVMLMIVGAMAITPVSKWIAGGEEPVESDTKPGEKTEHVAILNDWRDAKWLEDTRPPLNNPRLDIGRRLVLASGSIEVKYLTGARVVIEGPAEFVVGPKDEGGRMKDEGTEGHPSSFIPHPSNAGFLRLGTLVARVEGKKAQGFTIDTPNARVEDFGTEFGVEVARSGRAEVVVLSGEVEVVRDEGNGPAQRVRLVKDEGAFVEAEGRAITHLKKVDARFAAKMRSRLEAIRTEPEVAELVTQLGVLDLTANGGINPATGRRWRAGDKYRLIFATSTGRNATSADIEDYNNFVQNAANASSLGLDSVTWKAIASTETIDARDNTSTNTAINGPGESIWLVDGKTLVAEDYTDLYGSDTHRGKIMTSETGGATPATPNGWGHTWTGSSAEGVALKGEELGAADGTSIVGLRNFTSGAHWIARFQDYDQSEEYSLYGISEALTLRLRADPKEPVDKPEADANNALEFDEDNHEGTDIQEEGKQPQLNEG